MNRERDVHGRTSTESGAADCWIGWIERLLFLLPVVVGAGVLGVLQRAPQPRLANAALLVAAVGAFAVRFGVPLCLWLDAGAITRRTRRWEPNGWLYAAAALSISAPLVALVYLYRRHERVPRSSSGRWWYVLVWIALLVGVVAIAAGIVTLVVTVAVGVVPGAVATGFVVLAGVVAGVFPAGIYYDAVYVRNVSSRWNPNPALYLAAALGSLLVGILQPLVAGYYLFRRKSVGRRGGVQSSARSP